MKKITKIIVTLSLAAFLSGCKVTASGEKIGTIVKLSQEGFIFNTWEAELIRGGMNNGSGAFGIKPFDFSIDNSSLISKVKESLEKQKEVKIKYHCEWLSAAWRGNTNCFLDNITEDK